MIRLLLLLASVARADFAPMPVSGTFYQATQPVSTVSTFPVSIAVMPTTPVTGTFYQATQPVSTVSTFPVSIAVMPTTPVTGTFFQAVQPANIINSVTVTPGTGTFTVGTHGVSQSGSFTVTPGTGVYQVSSVGAIATTSTGTAVAGSVTVTPGTGTWATSGAFNAGSYTVTPGTGVFQAAIINSVTVTPGTGTFTVGTHAVSQSGSFTVTAGTGTFTVSNSTTTSYPISPGRTMYVAVSSNTPGIIAETLMSFGVSRALAATGAAASSLSVTAGKTLRIETICATYANTTLLAGGAVIRCRYNSPSVVVATSTIFATLGLAMSSTTARAGITYCLPLPQDGYEFSGSAQIGCTQTTSATTATIDVNISGYEYAPY